MGATNTRQQSAKVILNHNGQETSQQQLPNTAIIGNDPTNAKATVMRRDMNSHPVSVDKESRVYALGRHLMEREREVLPLVRYVQVKVEAHGFERKYDDVILIDSSSALFSLLRKLPDASHVLNVEVIYERTHQNVHLPIYLEQMVPRVPCMTLAVKETTNSLDSNLVVWLQVLEMRGQTTNYQDRFDFDADTGNKFLRSWQYQKFIPGEYDYGIFGEKEVHINKCPILPKFSRTFKTEELAISANGKEFKFVCFVNKLAAVRVPWPENSSDFHRRESSWPSKSAVSEIVNRGCHVVPKPRSKESGSRDWTYDFSVAAMILESEFSEPERAVYLILELLKRNYLDVDGDINSGLKAYHLKTAMFWTCTQQVEDVWHENLEEALRAVLKNLLSFLRENNCPDFFIPSINLFQDLWEQQKQAKPLFDWMKKATPRAALIAKLQDMLKNLDRYLAVDLLEMKTATEKQLVEDPSPTKDSPMEVSQALRFLGDLVQSAIDRSAVQ